MTHNARVFGAWLARHRFALVALAPVVIGLASLALTFRGGRAALSPARDFEPAPGRVTVIWLGTAGLYVTDGESAFLIDPFVSRPGLLRVALGLDVSSNSNEINSWLRRLKVPRGAPVLITHTHYDHALDASSFAAAVGGKLYGSTSLLQIARGADVPATQVEAVTAGATIPIGRFRVRFVAACHGPQLGRLEIWSGDIEAPLSQPSAASAYRTGEHFALAVEHPDGSFYHQASPCIRPGMYDGVRAGTIFLGIAARSDTRALVAAALAGTHARQVVPIHWDNFFRSLGESITPLPGVGLNEFVATVRASAPGVDVKVLWPGEATSL